MLPLFTRKQGEEFEGFCETLSLSERETMVRHFSDARGLRSLCAVAEPWMQFFALQPDAIWLGVLNGWLQDGCLPSVRGQ